MRRKYRSRFCSVAYGLLSASLIACLLIAPLCAVRCAATVCTPASPDGSADGCHHASNHTGCAPAFTAKSSSGPCATGELLFTTPRLQDLSTSIASFAAPTVLLPAELNASSQLGVTAETGGTFASSARLSEVSSSPFTPLRL